MTSTNSFKSKFNLILLISLSAIILLGCSIIFTIISIRSSEENSGNLSKASLNLSQSQSAFRAFLINAGTDEGFMSSGVSQDVSKFENAAKDFRSDLTFLKENLSGEYLDSLNNIEKDYDSLNNSFKRIAHLIKNRGFKNIGLEGKMQESVHNLENSSIIDKNLLYNLRTSENNFLLRKDKSYVSNFNNTITEIKNVLNNLNESEDKTNLQNNLDSYENAFGEIVSIETEIGLTSSEGLRGTINLINARSQERLAALRNTFEYKSTSLITTTIVFLSIVLLIMFTGVYIGLNRFVKPAFEPIHEIQSRATEISEGNLSVRFDELRDNNVLKDLIIGLERIVSRFRSTMEQVENISSRKIVSEIPLTSDKDEVGKTVNLIISQLKAIDNEEAERTWHNEGLAKFAHLLRVNSNDAATLYDSSIKELVKYMDANQGGLFILEGEDGNNPHLLMKGCYAYDRKKFYNKKKESGEGLVGMCWDEGQTIFMSEIPKDYFYITSGIGGASPSSIVIVPIKFNDEIFGIIELASFKIFKKHEIKFIETIAESFGSAVHNMKTNTKTQSLLEKSQIMTEELRAQEEEMRQNMEELQATQEEMERNVTSLKQLTKEFEVRERIFGLTTILSESDKYGTILDVNSKLCEVSGYTKEELIGKPHNIFRDPDMPKELFKLFWDTIKSGKTFTGIIKNRGKGNIVYWVDATIVPVKDDSGNIVKYMGARYHIQDKNLAIILYNQQAQKLGFPMLKNEDIVS